jgi:hypothetical protein
MATKEQFEFIDERFDQLIKLSTDGAEQAAKFLFLSNTGGAAATLSFLGAVESIRSQYAPKVALGLFVVGIIIVGVQMAIRVHHAEGLLSNFRHDVIAFYGEQIKWKTLTDEDLARSEKVAWIFITGYASFRLLYRRDDCRSFIFSDSMMVRTYRSCL